GRRRDRTRDGLAGGRRGLPALPDRVRVHQRPAAPAPADDPGPGRAAGAVGPPRGEGLARAEAGGGGANGVLELCRNLVGGDAGDAALGRRLVGRVRPAAAAGGGAGGVGADARLVAALAGALPLRPARM